ncbi:hypothetical protein GCM10009810_08130 [Nostocoides vanveenii]|uniref:Uncharacterized protein n=2 Tax=Nostocoides vanveenii TaxID=330835 RepID=A0ABN2K7Z6_9MICO
MAAALIWALSAIGWIAGNLVLQDNWADIGDAYGHPAAVLAAGFAPQVLLGAMSYLVPSVIGGGPAAVRAAGPWVDKWAVCRLVTINGGLALTLLPTPPAVRALPAGVVVAAYGLALPLLGLGIRASLRARRERPDRLAAHRCGTRRIVGRSGRLVSSSPAAARSP